MSSVDKLFENLKDVAENSVEDPAITYLIQAFAAMKITCDEIASPCRKRSRSSSRATPTSAVEESDYRPTAMAKRKKTMPSPSTADYSSHREEVISNLKKFKSDLDEVIIQLENNPEISVKDALQGMLCLSLAQPLNTLAAFIEPRPAEKQPLALVVEPRPAEDHPLALTVERRLVEDQRVDSQSSVVEEPSELIAEVSSSSETAPDYDANLSRKRNNSSFDVPPGNGELDEFSGSKKRRVMNGGEAASIEVPDADAPIDLSTKRRPIKLAKRLRNRHGIFQPWLQTE